MNEKDEEFPDGFDELMESYKAELLSLIAKHNDIAKNDILEKCLPSALKTKTKTRRNVLKT